MPGGAFRMLVAAIVGVALLAIVYTYFGPIFFPAQDPVVIISAGFDKAEIGANKVQGLGKIIFPSGTALNAKSFDSKTRVAGFRCNSTGCMENAREDSNARTIYFRNTIGLEASVRCTYEYGLSVCRLYLGEIPAQLEVAGAKASPEKPDFVKTKTLSVEFEARNSGKLDSKESSALVELYGKTGEEKELQDSKIIPIGEIRAGEGIKKSSILSLKAPGEQEVVITVEGNDAGKDIKIIPITVLDSTPSACVAKNQESFSLYDYETRKCRQRLYCNSCTYGFECRNAWQARLPGAGIGAGDSTVAYRLTDSINGQCG